MKSKKFWEIRNSAEEGEPVDLLFYGDIESDGFFQGNNSSTAFAADLNACGGKDIRLRINSPGGNIFEAQAIYNLLKSYKGKVTAHIDGLCASAATVVACAAESITMPANSLFMIHNPSCYLDEGMEAEDLRKTADMLDSTKASIVNVYLARTKGKLTEENIRHMMDEETWMTSDEALENGFVDEVDNFGIDAAVDKGVVVVNGISMPHIRERQEELVSMMTGKKKVNDVKQEDNEVMAAVRNALEKLGLVTAAPKEPQAKAKEPQAGVQVPVQDEADKEKERLQALDALEGKNPYAKALIEAAKKGTATADSIKNFVDALNAVPEPQVKVVEKTTLTVDEITKLIQDQLASGAQGVGSAPQGAAQDKAAKAKAAAEEVVSVVNNVIRK